MATITNFCAALSVAIIFAISQAPSSTSEPTISASPSVLPYVTAPNMSSFFPSPSVQGPPSSTTPPNSETLAPVPSSGEFVGKSSSDSTRLDSGILISDSESLPRRSCLYKKDAFRGEPLSSKYWK